MISSAKALWTLRQAGGQGTFLEVAVPTVGAALVWSLLTPPIVLWAFAQPPASRAPWRLVTYTVLGALGLPWIHAIIRSAWDLVLATDMASVSTFYMRYFSPDAFALVGLVALAQTVIHVDQVHRERERRAVIAADAARADVEAHRLMAQPPRLRAALAALQASIVEAPQHTESATVLLGDLLRRWQITTGKPEISLEDEIATFQADRAFTAALTGSAPDIRTELAVDVFRARVPNGILAALLEEGVIHSAYEVPREDLCIKARREDSTLRLSLEGPASVQTTPGERRKQEGSLGERLDRLYSWWRLDSSTSEKDGIGRVVIELPYSGESEVLLAAPSARGTSSASP